MISMFFTEVIAASGNYKSCESLAALWRDSANPEFYEAWAWLRSVKTGPWTRRCVAARDTSVQTVTRVSALMYFHIHVNVHVQVHVEAWLGRVFVCLLIIPAIIRIIHVFRVLWRSDLERVWQLLRGNLLWPIPTVWIPLLSQVRVSAQPRVGERTVHSIFGMSTHR